MLQYLTVVNLTLIDLPGLTKVAVGNLLALFYAKIAFYVYTCEIMFF